MSYEKPVRLLTIGDQDEMRRVSYVLLEEGGLLLIERTDGELTYEVFGTCSQTRVVRIGSEHMAALCSALGAEHASLDVAMREFFYDAEVFLSDLLDLLDARGVPYRFACTGMSDIAMRTSDYLAPDTGAPSRPPQDEARV